MAMWKISGTPRGEPLKDLCWPKVIVAISPNNSKKKSEKTARQVVFSSQSVKIALDVVHPWVLIPGGRIGLNEAQRELGWKISYLFLDFSFRFFMERILK